MSRLGWVLIALATAAAAAEQTVPVIARVVRGEVIFTVGASAMYPAALVGADGGAPAVAERLRLMRPNHVTHIFLTAADRVPPLELVALKAACTAEGITLVTDVTDAGVHPAVADGGLVMGSLDKGQIREVVDANRAQIRRCYDQALDRAPKLEGKVRVKFVIQATGAVAEPIVEEGIGNAELEACVVQQVKTWVFPRPKGGGVVIVTYPFHFSQSPKNPK